MKPYYVAFDPGKDTGVAAFTKEGVLTPDFKILRGFDKLYAYLDGLEKEKEAKVFIVERYRVAFSRHNLMSGKYSKIHGGQPVLAEQAIGVVKRTAWKIGAEVVFQEPAILINAQKWSGMRIPTNHSNSHNVAAYNHGIFYLVSNNIIKPRVLDDYKNK